MLIRYTLKEKEFNKSGLAKRCNCKHCDFYYRYFRLVKILLKVTLFDTLYDFILRYPECVKRMRELLCLVR